MQSYLIVQTIAALALALAALLQLGVLKAPDIPDPDVKRSGRKVMILALACAAVYLAYITFDGRRTDPPMVLFLGLIGMSQALFGLNRLFPDLYRHGTDQRT